MLIEKLLDFVEHFIHFILGWINIPDMPNEVVTVMEQIKTYMIDGIGLLSFFVDMRLLGILLTLYLTLYVVASLVKIFRWVIKKIPIGNMS